MDRSKPKIPARTKKIAKRGLKPTSYSRNLGLFIRPHIP